MLHHFQALACVQRVFILAVNLHIVQLEDNEISFDRCSNMKAKVSVGQTLELAKRCGQIGKEITISIILSPQDLTHPCSTGEDQYYVVINGEVYSKDADRSQMGVH